MEGNDIKFMREALKLARRGIGATSPNPAVGAVVVKNGRIIGRGWHRAAGLPHAEAEAIQDATKRGHSVKGATLYVTLEPCSTFGRTPPCTDAIIASGIKRVVVGATDPNPKHRGRGFAILRERGIEVVTGVLEKECTELNEGFNHWIVYRTPFVTVKAAMTADGKIATAKGESKWITSERARQLAMRLRAASDAVLVGVNTVLIDNPSLTVRKDGQCISRQPWRIILDSMARTPLSAKVISDEFAHRTLVVVSPLAPPERVRALSERVEVLVVPVKTFSGGQTGLTPRIDLMNLLQQLGDRQITSLLVEGGGEVNASFILQGFAHRVAFFYAPIIMGGRDAIPPVGGIGVERLSECVRLVDCRWRRIGQEMFLTAKVAR